MKSSSICNQNCDLTKIDRKINALMIETEEMVMFKNIPLRDEWWIDELT